MPQFIFFLNFYLKIYIQSTLVISNSTGLSKLLRDIFSSTYQICRIEDKINRTTIRGWSGVAKVSCILRHRGVQLILANSLARPAILVAGKGRGGGDVLFLLFLFLFLPYPSLSSPLLSLLSLFSLSLGDDTK